MKFSMKQHICLKLKSLQFIFELWKVENMVGWVSSLFWVILHKIMCKNVIFNQIYHYFWHKIPGWEIAFFCCVLKTRKIIVELNKIKIFKIVKIKSKFDIFSQNFNKSAIFRKNKNNCRHVSNGFRLKLKYFMKFKI